MKLLVIDHRPEALEGLTRLFQEHGHETESARSAETGFQKARAAVPALIALNLLLPGGSGTALLERLAADGALRDVPVLILTGAAPGAGHGGGPPRTPGEPPACVENPARPEHVLAAVEALLAPGRPPACAPPRP